MPSTTFRQFVDRLEAIAVTGVKLSSTTGRPNSLNSSDLPAKWVQFPRGEDGTFTVFDGVGGWPALHAEIAIAVEAVGQSDGPENFDLSVDMMDALQAALEDTECGITKTKITWNIVLTIRAVAEVAYWTIVSTVSGKG